MAGRIKKSKLDDYRDAIWNNKFEQLKKFKLKYGHCDVSSEKKSLRSLAAWCTKQRISQKFEPIKVLDYRIKKLNSIGFCWSIRDKYFDLKFESLKKHQLKYGNCKVTRKQNATLFKWCVCTSSNQFELS